MSTSTSTGWTIIGTGYFQGCGVDGGALACWGSNSFGELGLGQTTSGPTPITPVGGPSTFRAVDGGTFFTCAVATDGSLACTGSNDFGQLATGDFTARTSFAAASSLTGWQQISADQDSACGIRNGELHCWGSNRYGVLGHGDGLVPAPVTAGP